MNLPTLSQYIGKQPIGHYPGMVYSLFTQGIMQIRLKSDPTDPILNLYRMSC